MKIAITLLTFILMTSTVTYHAGFRINLSTSYPIGLYQITPTSKFQLGELVAFCPPDNETIQKAREYGYLQYGFCPSGTAPLLKRIMATGGANITLTDIVHVDGFPLTQYRIHDTDNQQRPLPKLHTLTLKKNEYFLLSDYSPKDSYDSRYFGAVPKESLLGVATAIYTL